VRLNGYLPFDRQKTASNVDTFAALLSGNNIFVQRTNTLTREFAMFGLDAEVGFRVSLEPIGGAGRDDHELRLYAGAFFFNQDGFHRELIGPKGRVSYRINDVITAVPGSRLTLEAQARYDEVRNADFTAGFRLRIPFSLGAESGASRRLADLTAQSRRMMEGIERDTDVVVSKQDHITRTNEPAEDALTGVDLTSVVRVSTGDNLQAALDGGGPNTLFIVDGGTRGQTIVRRGQTVQSGGSTIPIRSRSSGAVVDFTAPGAMSTIRHTLDSEIVTMSANSHIAGFDIIGAGKASGLADNQGIVAVNGADNIAISEVAIRSVGRNGIRFNSNHTGIQILDTKIIDAGDDAIEFEDNNRFSIVRTTIRRPDDDGIEFGDDNVVTIVDTNIMDPGDNGLDFFFDNRVDITGGTIGGAGSSGLDFLDGNTINLTGTTIRDTGVDGLLGDDDNVITLVDTVLRDIGIHGIDLLDGNRLTLRGTTIDTTGDDAIVVGIDNTLVIRDSMVGDAGSNGLFAFLLNTVTISDTTFANSAVNGLIFGLANTVTLNNVTIDGAGDDALELGPGNDVTMNNTLFTGTIVDDVIDIKGAASMLSGTGNDFTGTFGSNFCEVAAGQTGSFGFDSGPQAACP